MRRVALALVALALTGCETTADRSARLEKAALARARPAASQGVRIAAASHTLLVVSKTLVSDKEGLAVALTVRNTSGRAQIGAPVAVTVKGPTGSTVYTNGEPGLAHSLTALGAVPAHGQVSWVDDQVQASGAAASLSITVGDGKKLPSPPGTISVSSKAPVGEPGGGESIAGQVTNGSGAAQRELVVSALARRGGKVVGAGRAVIANLAEGASTPFEIFIVGSAKDAQIELSAPASTAG